MNEQRVSRINAWTEDGILSRAAGDALVQWSTEPGLAAYRDEIHALVDAGRTDELEDAFGSVLSFGTGGIRGRMGPGPNRLNTRTVGMAAQGLARYVTGMMGTGDRDREGAGRDGDRVGAGRDGDRVGAEREGDGRGGDGRGGDGHGGDEQCGDGHGGASDGVGHGGENRCGHVGARGVVVAWDTRRNSELFAKETAGVLAANGIQVLIFDGFRSTPALSFAVRELRAAAGVMISASHNPPGDNGFKVFGPDGGQVVAPRDGDITREMRRAGEIRRIDYEEGLRSGLIRIIGRDLDERYIGVLSEMTLAGGRDVRVVYTPLHGVGMTSVAAALDKLGYENVHYVDEQVVPDGAFPTLDHGIANPEKPAAFQLGFRKAAEVGADLVLASDPDADRIGCALPLPDRGWEASPEELRLNGHQIGVLLCHYILSRKQAAGTLPPRGLFCKTLVTSDLAAIIARSFGLEVIDDLPVGFKHVGAAIDGMPQDMTFVFGTEESHGYLADTRIRDKEAATGILLAEFAALAKEEGRTLRDELDDIYRTYGYFREVQRSVALPGAEGARRIEGMMAALREAPPERIGGRAVCRVIDRQSGQAQDLRTGTTTPVDGDRADILVFTLSESGHTRVIARPSGTEPTVKCYVSAASVDIAGTREAIDGLAESILSAMIGLCEGIKRT